MTTLLQLPLALTTGETDLLLLEQQSETNAVTVQTLLAGTQPKLTLASGVLLGRVSIGPGGPEPVDLGSGLVVSAGSLAIDATLIAPLASPALTGTPTAPTPAAGDSSNAIATTAFVQAHTGPLTVTGDVVGSGSGAISLTLPAITTAGTYAKVAVNAKGQVTGGAALGAADVTGALGFMPYNAANPSGFVAAPTLLTFPALAFGAHFDGVHDDAPGITAAIAAAYAAGGGIVLLPAGRGRIGSTIVQPYSNVQLVGAGAAIPTTGATSGTTLTWIGAAGGTMAVVGPQQSGPPYTGARSFNCDVRGIVFDCNAIAATGLQIQSVIFSDFDVGYNEPNQCGVLVTTVYLQQATSAGSTAYQINDTQHNQFTRIAGSITRTISTTVATTVAGGGVTIPLASTTGFVAGMRVLVGSSFHTIASVGQGRITTADTVTQADATAGNTVAFAPRGTYVTALPMPAGYFAVGSANYPQLWAGNTSLNLFRDVVFLHYAYGGAGFAFGYSDHNRIDKIVGYVPGGTAPAIGLEFEGSASSGYASANNAVAYCAAQTVVRGTTSFAFPSAGTAIGCFDSSNVGVPPVQEQGATLTWTNDAGIETTGQIVGLTCFEAGWEPVTGTWHRAGSTSLGIVNNSGDHLHLATGVGGTDWQVRIDSSANFQIQPIANGGSIVLGGPAVAAQSVIATGTVQAQSVIATGTSYAVGFSAFEAGWEPANATWQRAASTSLAVVNNSGDHLHLASGVGGTDWQVRVDGSGNFQIQPIANAGSIYLSGPGVAINGALAVAGALTAANPAAGDNSTHVATTAWVSGRGYLQQAATIAALRAVPVAGIADGATMQVDCYAVRGDGGAGLFVWNAASTAADNGGVVVMPTGQSGAGRWVRQLADGRLTPQMFGAKGDGVTDDTAAFTAALAAGPVVVPSAKYVVGNVIVPNGAWMEGGAGLGYSGDIGTGTPSASQKAAVVSPILLAKAGTTSCILNVNGCNDATLKGLFLDGVTTGCDGVSSGSTQLMMERVTVVRCVNGLGATATTGYTGLTDLYTHVATLINCEFANCTNGIANPIDSAMLGGACSANVVGVNLGSGANANSFIAVRYEWNSQDGVQGYQCASNTFTGGLFDRNNWRAVNLGTGCYDFTFTGVQFARNGAVNTYPNNSHIALNGTTSVFFNGCVSRTGMNDDGTGNLSPAYFVNYINTNALVTISGCDVSGYVTGFAFGTNPTAYVQRDNDGAGDSFINAARPYVSSGVAAQTLITKAAANIAPGASTTVPMGQSPLTSNYSVTARELIVTATNFNSPYQSCGARFNLAFYRDTAMHAPGASAAYGEAGGTGLITWGGTGKLRLSASALASDGSSWTLNVLNGGTADGSNWGVWAELR